MNLKEQFAEWKKAHPNGTDIEFAAEYVGKMFKKQIKEEVKSAKEGAE